MQIRTTSLNRPLQSTFRAQAGEATRNTPTDSFSFSKVDPETVKFWAKAAPFSLAGVGVGAGAGAFVGKVIGRGLGEVMGQGASFQTAGSYLGGVLGAIPGGYFGTFVGVSMQV